MPLSVIGVGYPRTATLSLKMALEHVGFGPCHHMTEAFKHPQRWPGWMAAAAGESVDCEGVFEGYAATADAPGCYFFDSLATAYPDANFILTVRPSNKWWESASATVFNDENLRPMLGTPMEEMVRRVVLDRYGGHHAERAYMISAYERHNTRVREEIPAERLLVYQPRQGWEPICRFLDIAVPDVPFPHVNDRAEFGKLPTMAGDLAHKDR